MAAIAALAKFASFTVSSAPRSLSSHLTTNTVQDVFLSGLVIPLIPTIIETRLHAPKEQGKCRAWANAALFGPVMNPNADIAPVQILTSVLVASYGGAVVAVSRTPLPSTPELAA